MVKYLFIVFMVFSVNLSAQIKQGELVIEGIGDYEGHSIIQTKDGGYAIAGFSYSNLDDVYLLKLDSSGNMLWSKTIGTQYIDQGCSIVQTSDGGYAITGMTNAIYTVGDDTMYGKVYIIRLDSIGNILWTRAIGGDNNDRGYSIVQTSDNGFAITGSTNSYGAGGYDIYIVKIDAVGNLQWTKAIGTIGDDVGFSIIQSKDGGYAVTGVISSYTGYHRLCIIKLDSLGNLQWVKSTNGNKEEGGNSIIQTNDGGYAIVGGTASYGDGGQDVYVLKLDSFGSLQWTKTIGDTLDDVGFSIVQTKDGGYAVTGFTNGFEDMEGLHSDVYMLKMDSSGSFKWTRTIKGSGAGWGFSIIQTKDEGYAITGFTSSYGSGGNDVYVLKFDSMGRLCSTADSGGLIGMGGNIMNNDSLILSSGGTIFKYDSIVSYGGTYTNICEVITSASDVRKQTLDAKIYPNPCSGIFHIISNDINGATIVICNILGKAVYHSVILSPNSEIDLTNIPAGVYFVQIKKDNGIETRKLVKE